MKSLSKDFLRWGNPRPQESFPMGVVEIEFVCVTIENSTEYGGETAVTQVKRMKRICILNGILDAMADQIGIGASSRYREIEKIVSMDHLPSTTPEELKIGKNERNFLNGIFSYVKQGEVWRFPMSLGRYLYCCCKIHRSGAKFAKSSEDSGQEIFCMENVLRRYFAHHTERTLQKHCHLDIILSKDKKITARVLVVDCCWGWGLCGHK